MQPQYIIADTMPVELTSFTAKVFGNSILLNWQTSTEINNYGFEVERKTEVPSKEVKPSEEWAKLVLLMEMETQIHQKLFIY